MFPKRSGERSAFFVTVTAGIALAVVAGAVLGSQSACQLQSVCAPSTAWWPPPTPSNATGAVTVALPNSSATSEYRWESNGLDDPWLYFPGGRTYTIFPFTTSDWQSAPRFYGPDWDIEIWVATDQMAASTGNFTPAAGNIAEVFFVTDPTANQFSAELAAAIAANAPLPTPPVFNVVNASCADYYVRIVVTRNPIDDAGTASVVDAGSDGPDDAAGGAPPDSSPDGGVD